LALIQDIHQGDNMAGYFLYSLDFEVFKQLTTAPTDEMARLVAQVLLLELEESDPDEIDTQKWPSDVDALAATVKNRLAASDWYSDLTYGSAVMWDNMLHNFSGELGKALKLGFECASDWESIYWDCANAAAAQGASMMAEPLFGNSGFRYSGKPTSEWNPFPMYTFYEPPRVRELLAQLEPIADWFEDQGGEEEEEFMEGLLIPVRQTAEANRVLWVQTDT